MSTNAPSVSIANQWSILRSSSRADDAGILGIPSIALSVGSDAGALRLAVGANGEARLLLPLSTQENFVGIVAGSALSLTISAFMQGQRTLRFLDLMCVSAELESAFGDVVDEIVGRVANGMGCSHAVRTTLDDFRALLVAPSADRVERGRVAGLVAELIILNRLLDHSPAAWRAWSGPTGDRHDFRVASTSLEVKASLQVGSPTAVVNGLDQLEPPLSGTLHLAHFAMEAVSGGLLTVSGLGRRAMTLTDDPRCLGDLFVSIGCPDVSADAWNRDAFKLDSEALFRVEGDFPRVAPSMFVGGVGPPGVSDLNYRIDLSHASDHRCSASEFDTLLRVLAR